MATIASLVVNLTTETASFAAGMDRAGRMADSGASRISNALAGIRFPAAAIFTAAAAGIGAMIKTGIDAADAMYEMSQQAGISTEKLSALNYAAGQSGIATEELVSNITKLSKNMYAAAEGSGAASDAFSKLGIKVKASDGTLRGADEVIEDIAERFSKMSDGAEKTAISMQFFGKAGASMVPLLNDGAAGLQRMTDEANRAGVVIGGKTAAAADQFNDNLDRLGKTMTGFSIKIAGPFVDALNKIFEGFDRAQSRSEGFFSSFVSGMHSWFAGSADKADLKSLQREMTQLQENMLILAELRKKSGRDPGPSDIEMEKYGALAKKISLLKAKIAGYGETAKTPTVPSALVATSDAAEKAREKVDSVIASLKFEEAQIGRTSVQQAVYNKLKEAGLALMPGLGGEAADIVARVVKNEELRKSQEDLNQSMADGLTMGNDMAQAYYDRQSALRDQIEGMRTSALSPMAAENEDYAAKLAVLDEYYQGKADKQAEYQSLFEDLASQHSQNLSAIDADRNAAVVAAEDYILQRKYDAANMTADLLTMVAGKSRIAAFAAIALQKGVAIAQIIANGASASIAALSPPPLGLGPVAGAPLSASIKLWTGVQAALVGATGIAQFAGGGSGASTSGIPSTRGSVPSGGGSDSGQAAVAPPQTVVTIALRDDQIFSGSAVRTLIEKINDALGDGAKLATA